MSFRAWELILVEILPLESELTAEYSYETRSVNYLDMKIFIDDLFFLWLGSREELEKFIIYVNSIFPNIKLTAEYSYETRSLNCLDMEIYIDDQGYIYTRRKTRRITIFFLPAVILTI